MYLTTIAQAIGRTVLTNPTKRAFYMRANTIGITLIPGWGTAAAAGINNKQYVIIT